MRYFIILWALSIGPLSGQLPETAGDDQHPYDQGLELFQDHVYGASGYVFDKYVQQSNDIYQIKSETRWMDAQQKSLLAYLYQNDPHIDDKINHYLEIHGIGTESARMLKAVADYYYNSKNHSKALEYYQKIESNSLSSSEQIETQFMIGYLAFSLKDFITAKQNLEPVSNIESKYQLDAMYYSGLIAIFDNQLDKAQQKLTRCLEHKKYGQYVPAILTQIHFNKKNYPEVISYGEQQLKKSNVKNQGDIHLFVGQAYFEQKNYQSALPHFSAYEKSGAILSPVEQFQFGYSYFQVDNFTEAIPYFKGSAQEKNTMGQAASMYLGIALAHIGNLNEARNAFFNASQSNANKMLQEEATLQYAKISLETNFVQDALNTCLSIAPQSKTYTEAQNLVGTILLRFQDPDQVLEVASKISNPNNKIKEAVQKAYCNKAQKAFASGNIQQAVNDYKESLQNVGSVNHACVAYASLAEIEHQSNRYPESEFYVTQYQKLQPTATLPFESSKGMVSYIHGYNLLKKGNFKDAYEAFKDSKLSMEKTANVDQRTKDLYVSDASMRYADCAFKQKSYSTAEKIYQESVKKQYPNFEYAMYQIAMIEGLQGNTAEKLVQLEDLYEKYPKSEYADDALFEIGTTYLEVNNATKAFQHFKLLTEKFENKSALINTAYLRMGLISYNNGTIPQATEYYKKVLNNKPEPKEANEALDALQEIYVHDLNQPDEYIKLAEQSGINLSKNEKDTLAIKAADNQFNNGNYEKAIQSYSKYLASSPNTPTSIYAHYKRAESYYALKNHTSALPDFMIVVEKGQGKWKANALYKSGLINYNELKNYQQALDLFAKLESATDDADLIYESQQNAFLSATKLKDAGNIELFAGKIVNSSRAKKEHIAPAKFQLARIAQGKKDYTKAIKYYTDVTQLVQDGMAAESRYLIAQCYFEQNLLDKAEEEAQVAASKSSGYSYWVAKSIILLSDVYVAKQDLFNARAALEAVIENYKNDTEITKIAQDKLKQLETLETHQKIAPDKMEMIDEPVENK